MEIVHVSAECYPVAKAGGLGDVVGALPRFQQELGNITKVIMPMYRTTLFLRVEHIFLVLETKFFIPLITSSVNRDL